jgi:hypothetical protein
MPKLEPWPQSKGNDCIEHGVSSYEPKDSPGAINASVPRLKLQAGASQAVFIAGARGAIWNPHRDRPFVMRDVQSNAPHLAVVGGGGRLSMLDQVVEIGARSPGVAKIQARNERRLPPERLTIRLQ